MLMLMLMLLSKLYGVLRIIEMFLCSSRWKYVCLYFGCEVLDYLVNFCKGRIIIMGLFVLLDEVVTGERGGDRVALFRTRCACLFVCLLFFLLL